MNYDSYLSRLNYHGPLETNLETLTALHLAHLHTVPFENLDIRLGYPITLSLPDMFKKVVEHRRGGFCYELNALFAWLLEQLGFNVSLLSARVYSDKKLGPEFDHLLLQVHLDRNFVADIGFGDNFLKPLLLDTDTEQIQGEHAYQIIDSNLSKILQRRYNTGVELIYAFTLLPREFGDFADMCHFQQSSPESSFTQKTVCSRLTQDGRITLSNRLLIETGNGIRHETVIESADAYREILNTQFDIVLSKNEIETLFSTCRGEPACSPK